jgi:hypothetical protein
MGQRGANNPLPMQVSVVVHLASHSHTHSHTVVTTRDHYVLLAILSTVLTNILCLLSLRCGRGAG